jgi:hypothetical protein
MRALNIAIARLYGLGFEVEACVRNIVLYCVSEGGRGMLKCGRSDIYTPTARYFSFK